MEASINKFAEPRRQASIAIVIILLKFLRTTVKSFWPIALSFFIGGKSRDAWENYLAIAVIAISILNLGGSVLTYFRYFIQIKDDAVIIDKGILKRTKTNIPFERIQSVNFKQNLIHQFFGVVSIEIDTAGAKKSELTIDALDKAEAEAFRELIMQAKTKIAAENTSEKSNETINKTDKVIATTILHLSVTDLFKIGISQNHLRSMGILLGFSLTIMNDINENFDGIVENELSGFSEFVSNSEWLIFLFFIIGITIISFVYSLIITTLRNYDLKLSLNKKGLKLLKGLLNREEISIHKNKIQIISWADNPLRRLFKMWTLGLEQASSDEASKLQAKIRVPGCYIEQVEKVSESVFPSGEGNSFSKHKVSKLLKYRLLFFVSTLPFLLSLTTVYWIEWQGLWLLLWPGFTAFYIELYFRKRSFEINPEIFKNNRGAFGNRIEITQVHKIQAIEITQSWYQRRKKLANLQIFTAAGSLKVPFIAIDKALALEKYILYRVETDTREWM